MCDHLYKNRGFGILLVRRIQVFINRILQSSQEWMSLQIQPFNAHKNARNPGATLAAIDSTGLS